MTDSNFDSIPASLAEMLPVGMIAGGGVAAAAMAAVAQRQRAQAGWEAFHYERLSPTEFEITGGLVVGNGGSRRWQEPHETVVITEAEILQEMQRMLLPATPEFIISEAHSVPVTKRAESVAPKYLKIVLQLPDDPAGQQRLFQAFQLQADFFGARVQACSLHDASPVTLE
ncbi:MAG: hypothetical protein KGM99_00495 [Burkholderiales bacterium]|nr:hypothetical protein [Burkholderiales bacterium]